MKAPRAGKVKTRLATAVGDALAVEVYRAVTVAVMNATGPVDPGEFARLVCFAPPDAEAEIAAWLPGEALEAQASGDLGARMDEAFMKSFHRGSKATVLIGSDCLSVDHAAVIAALAALDTADVVLRAARDDGYTLIALKERQRALFTEMPWSTGAVMAATLARASAAGLRVEVHGPDSDLDTVDDLRAQLDVLAPHLGHPLERQVRQALHSPLAEGAISASNA